MMLSIAPENREDLEIRKFRAVLQDADAFAYHDGREASSQTYEKLVTANSTFKLSSFEPRAHIYRVSPTTLLRVLAGNNKVIGTSNQVTMFLKALEPKQLYTNKDIAHFRIYFGENI